MMKKRKFLHRETIQVEVLHNILMVMFMRAIIKKEFVKEKEFIFISKRMKMMNL